MNDLSFKFSTIFAEWQQQRGQHQPRSSSHNRNDQDEGTVAKSQVSVNLKSIRIDVPRFGNGDPQGWIFKIQQYFNFHNASEKQRLQIAPLYFDGKALAWYQWLHKNTKILSWTNFLHSLQVRFGPSELEDYQGKLTKLIQTGKVIEYQEEFEQFSNKVDGFSEEKKKKKKKTLLSCFISGLKPHIQHEVVSFKPSTLTKAMALDKI